MNSSKFFRTTALLGVLGATLLNAPAHAMMRGTAATSDRAEEPFLNTLPAPLVTAFVAKFDGVSHEHPVTLGDGRSLKMKFRLMTDTEQDLGDLRTLFGQGSDGQFKILLRENAAAIKNFMTHNLAGKFKWLFSCSDEAGSFTPVGFVFLDAPQLTAFDFLAMIADPITPKMTIAAPQTSLYAREAAALKPVITEFFKAATSRCGVNYGAPQSSQPWDPGIILTAFNGNSGMIDNVAKRFNFVDFTAVPGQPDTTYSADLLIWRGEPRDPRKIAFLQHAERTLSNQKTRLGLPAAITAEDRQGFEIHYGQMLQKQALAFTEYDAFLRCGGRRPLDIEGLTWIITKKRPGHSDLVVGTLTGKKEVGGAQLALDPTLFPSGDDPVAQAISQFFMGELVKSITGRR